MSDSNSVKARWGRVVRRASTMVKPTSRPTTPSNNSDRDSDSVSLTKQKVDTSPAVLGNLASAAHVPSPIAETPREVTAAQEDARGPSSLVMEVARATTPPAAVEVEVASPQGYVPPPLVDFTAGNPGAFTDDPDLLPQPTIAVDPYASSSRVDLSTAPQPQIVDEPQTFHDQPISISREPSNTKPATNEPSPFFPDRAPVTSVEGTQNGGFAAAVEQNTSIAPPTPPHYSPKFVPQVLMPDPTNYALDDDFLNNPLPSHHENDPATAPPVASSPAPVFAMPPYDYNMGHDVWGGKPATTSNPPMPVPEPVFSAPAAAPAVHPVESRQPSQTPATRDDPFASGKPQVAPKINTSHVAHLHMPQAQPSPQMAQAPILNEDDASGAVVMPLPSFRDVIPKSKLNQKASTSSFNYHPRHSVQTDETQPLLGAGTSKRASYLEGTTPNILDVSPLDTNGHVPPPWIPTVSLASVAPRLHELGWLEYHLPDGTFYYVHPTRKITTDVNLRMDKVLSEVTNFLENGAFGGSGGSHGASSRIAGNGKDVAHPGGPGTEIWLRDVGTSKRGFAPMKCYVDHHARTVIVDRVLDAARGKKKAVEEDQLDMEFRYWSFMEAHPAHTTLPAKSKAEAMDVLTWAWTDRLLPSNGGSIPAPFSQDECQELMNLIRGFNTNNPDDHGIQNRIVARILLRVAVWRQKYFRPNKPLPKDVTSNQLHLPTPRRPFARALSDLLISCVCLGLPYLFLERSRGRYDEETGSLGSGIRSSAPIFVIGACTCLVAAIILSASVTFLSLPGLESVTKTAALVAILFASLAMASTLIAVFKHKSDVERSVSVVGLEGLTSLSSRAVVLSLPLVFITYSLISFIAGITIYSLRGGSLFDPTLALEPFKEHTRYTVVAMVGAFAGVFFISWLAARR